MAFLMAGEHRANPEGETRGGREKDQVHAGTCKWLFTGGCGTAGEAGEGGKVSSSMALNATLRA